MESKDLNQKVEWEARRVATVFGVDRFGSTEARDILAYDLYANVGMITPCRVVNFAGTIAPNGIHIEWIIEEEDADVRSIEIGSVGSGSKVFWGNNVSDKGFRFRPGWQPGLGFNPTMPRSIVPAWGVRTNRLYDVLLARGLYCLGFEDEGVFSQLPELTGPEKLELRLSMPREFWPQKWLDEES